MINMINRLTQIEHIYKHLREKYNFHLIERGFHIDCSVNDPVLIIIACNFIDINRYILLDHASLGKEPAKMFLHEIKDSCGMGCRLDGQHTCYCSGKCFKKKKCAWLRYVQGAPYCYLACPVPPALPKIEKSPAYYREMALASCKTETQRELVKKLIPLSE